MPQSLSPLKAEGKDFVDVICRFFPAGTGAPTLGDSTGIKSVARSGVGAFLITFENVYPEFLGALGQVQLAAFADTDVQCGTFTQGTSLSQPNVANSTLVVTTKTGGAAADIAANANNSVTVVARFRRSGVQT